MTTTATLTTAATTARDITVDELRARLRRAQAALGAAGHFSVTFYQQDGGGCSIMYWARPDGSAVERCEEVGHGTLAECLAALDRYVDARRRPSTTAATAGAGNAPTGGGPRRTNRR